MDITGMVGIGIIAAALAVVLRQYKPEYAMLISIGTGILILSVLMAQAVPVFDKIETMLSSTGLDASYAQILLKALGICFLTQLACDTCKDAGEGAIASKIEVAGKLAVLLISLPLFEQVLSVVGSLMG